LIKQRKFKVNTPLEVIWRDTVADSRWMGSALAMDKEPDDLVASIGFFYKWDKKRLYISSMVGMCNRDRSTIPIGMIEKIYAHKSKLKL